METLTFDLGDCHGFGVQFSPFDPTRLACVAGQKYGLSGSGLVFILQVQSGKVILHRRGVWQDVLYDLCWSENDPHTIVTASGDGSLQIWRTTEEKMVQFVLKEHQAEVSSVNWNETRDSNLILSGSWDRSIKMWDPGSSSSISTFTAHQGVVHQAVWSPLLPGVFVSVSADNHLVQWDVRKQPAVVQSIKAHQDEVIAVDWNKYDQNVVVTSGADSQLRIWDLRKSVHPIAILYGNQMPSRRVKFSPFNKSQLLSASYDKSVRLWDYTLSMEPARTFLHHSEFVTDIAFNIQHRGQIADCSWDSTVKILQACPI